MFGDHTPAVIVALNCTRRSDSTAACKLLAEAAAYTWPLLKLVLDLQSLGGLKVWAMHHQTKNKRDPPKIEGNEQTPMSASTEALDSNSFEIQPGQAQATLTPDPHSGCGYFCQPWCLLLALTLLLLSLLGSWAAVHLTLGSHGRSPVRISASYDPRIPQDDMATIEPYFTTNCTMGKYNFHHTELLECWFLLFLKLSK